MSSVCTKQDQVLLYTDGSCLGNPGPGGWSAILQYGEHEKEMVGGADHTTNNRMELTAVLEGLKALTRRCQVTVVTDSQYVATILNGGKAKANRDLVHEVRVEARRHEVTVQQVRGHSGHEMNELADQLAFTEANHRKQMIAAGWGPY
ncbi:MAG TPA: ribonuclease HI [Chloroflexota bacterium]|nr:ribonuclease HI [Chloroflexota bacterium]HUM68135.1 ribonuclease HI [Chloroflexota bacterium]